MNVFLLDGTYELFRSFFGAPPATTPDGREVGATLGLCASLLALLRENPESCYGIAFDQVIESFRNDLFPGYKTSEGVDPSLLAQFPLAEQLSAALGLTVWPMREFEADDALATAARQLASDPRVVTILIATPDKDLAQCVVGERIVCLDRRRSLILDEAGVVAKFGVRPSSIADYLALVGDSADGIPGLKGWGPASSAALLACYGHIEAIPEAAADWTPKVRGAERLAQTLAEGRSNALLYRRLATLREDVPIEVSLESLAWPGAHRDTLEPLLSSLGGEGLLERVVRWSSS